MRNIIITLIFYYMVTLKSNNSNLKKKNDFFYLKKNHDLYQPYSPKNAHEGIGYEPADLTVHPPPRTDEGGFIFFV